MVTKLAETAANSLAERPNVSVPVYLSPEPRLMGSPGVSDSKETVPPTDMIGAPVVSHAGFNLVQVLQYLVLAR